MKKLLGQVKTKQTKNNSLLKYKGHRVLTGGRIDFSSYRQYYGNFTDFDCCSFVHAQDALCMDIKILNPYIIGTTNSDKVKLVHKYTELLSEAGLKVNVSDYHERQMILSLYGRDFLSPKHLMTAFYAIRYLWKSKDDCKTVLWFMNLCKKFPKEDRLFLFLFSHYFGGFRAHSRSINILENTVFYSKNNFEKRIKTGTSLQSSSHQIDNQSFFKLFNKPYFIKEFIDNSKDIGSNKYRNFDVDTEVGVCKYRIDILKTVY